MCAAGWEAVQGGDAQCPDWSELVRRAMAVKIEVICEDPYEKGRRAALNLGHTLGHAVESASHFSLRHGEAVAIGMVAAARLSEQMRMAESGLAENFAVVLEGLGLPTAIPADLDREAIRQLLKVDKKRADGAVRFVLPIRVGEVRTGIPIDMALIDRLLAT
jgi:shikimate kinase/3-dehydroquinate synthase